MACNPNNIILVSAAISACSIAYADDDTQVSSKANSTHTQAVQHAIPKHPAKDWKISAKDYTELLNDCGDKSDTEPEEQSKSSNGT